MLVFSISHPGMLQYLASKEQKLIQQTKVQKSYSSKVPLGPVLGTRGFTLYPDFKPKSIKAQLINRSSKLGKLLKEDDLR